MAIGGLELATAYVRLAVSTDGIAKDVRREFGSAEREAKRAGDRSGRMFAGGITSPLKGVAVKLGGLFAGVAVAAQFKDAVKGASDLEQSVGGVQAVFGKYAKQVQASSETAAKSLGLSKNAYNELVTVSGALLKNKGIKDFASQSQNLVKVGADLAAQFGGSTKDAVDALNAAMRGESDPIERYGISINEVAIKSELAARGQSKLTGAALEQAKAQARIAIVMRQSKDAQGAFGREADTAAGRSARLSAQWENITTTVGGALLPALSAVAGFLSDNIGPAFQTVSGAVQAFAGFLAPVQEPLLALGIGIGAAAVGFGVYTAAVTVATAVSTAFAAVFAILTSPITLAIAAIAALTAAVVYLWRNNEGFRTAVTVIWEGIKTAIAAAIAVVRATLAALGTFITTVFGPIWNVLSTVIRTVMGVVKEVVTTAATVVIAAFNLIKSVITNILIPVFQNVAHVLSVVLGPAFNVLRDVAVAAWEGLTEFIGQIWRNNLRPVFQAVGAFVTKTLPEFFTKGVSLIETAWEALKEVVKAPVRFVIQTVINDGLIAGYNKVIGNFPGTTKMEPLPLPFASGSWVPGHSPTDRSDNVPAMLTAGEFVTKRKSARKMRRKFPGLLEYINQHGSLPGYAGGGMVYPSLAAWIKKNVPGSRITSAYRPGSITSSGNLSNHASGRAVDIVGPNMMRIFQAIRSAFGPRIAELIYSPAGGMQVKNGRSLLYGGAVRAQHFDHVHWAMKAPVSLDGAVIPPGDVEESGWSLNPFDWIRGAVAKLVEKIPGLSSTFGKFLGAVPIKLVGDVITGAMTKFKDMIGSLFGISGDGTNDFNADGGSGVARWTPLVEQALRIMGQPLSLVSTVLRRMNQESGGNPNAVNNWDINAKRGDPSRGLMQVIGGTYRAYAHPQYDRGVNDPLSNVLASMRYAIARYGSLPRAYNRKGGYADGGLVDGWSLTGESDNILARLTAGEWVHDVATTSFYGPQVMAALGAHTVPRELIQGFAAGGPVLPASTTTGKDYVRAGGSGQDNVTPKRVIVQIGAREFEGYMSEIADTSTTRVFTKVATAGGVR